MTVNQPKKRYPQAERRKQLLTIAVDVFADKGISTARHAEIAKRANVAVSTIFFYFPSRSALVDSVLKDTERVFADLPRQIQSDSATPIVRRILMVFLEYIDQYPSHSRILFDWSASIRDPIWTRFLACQDRLIEGITNRIDAEIPASDRDDTNPSGVLAKLLTGMSYVLYIMKFSNRTDAEVADFIDHLVARLGA